MMWRPRDYLNYLLSPEGINLIFAALRLWAATRRWPVVCAVVTALTYVVLVVM